MENWGCEFLEFENPENLQIEKPKDYIYIPMVIMEKIVDQKISNETNFKDKIYIGQLMADIQRRGLINPAEITIGQNGIILSDGNHRYIACRNLHYSKFPVKIKLSNDKLKINGIKLQDIFVEFIQQYGK